MEIEESKKNTIKFYVFISVIGLLIIISILMILKYQVEGETNLPFFIDNITIVSTAEGLKKENTENKWAFDLVQNNDVYIQIAKNEEYDKTDYIQKIILDEFKVIQEPRLGSLRKYMPNSLEGRTFVHSEEYLVDTRLEYKGASKDSMKDLQIGNQGGVLAIRYENGDLAEYLSNEEEEIIHDGRILTKGNITLEDITCKVSFALTMKLADAAYKTYITLDLPSGDILTEGTTTKDIVEKDNLIYKRIRLAE